MQRGATKRAQERYAELDTAEAFAHAATGSPTARSCVAETPPSSITSSCVGVFREALSGTCYSEHVDAMKCALAGKQKWRLGRVIATAIETALRARDPEAGAHFATGIDRNNKDAVSELERAAERRD